MMNRSFFGFFQLSLLQRCLEQNSESYFRQSFFDSFLRQVLIQKISFQYFKQIINTNQVLFIIFFLQNLGFINLCFVFRYVISFINGLNNNLVFIQQNVRNIMIFLQQALVGFFNMIFIQSVFFTQLVISENNFNSSLSEMSFDFFESESDMYKVFQQEFNLEGSLDFDFDSVGFGLIGFMDFNSMVR